MKPKYRLIKSKDARVRHGKHQKLICKLCGFGTLNLGRICTACLREGDSRIAKLQHKEQQRREKIGTASKARQADQREGKVRSGPKPKIRKIKEEQIKRVREVYLSAKVRQVRGPVVETARVTGFTVSQVTHMLQYYRKEMEQATQSTTE